MKSEILHDQSHTQNAKWRRRENKVYYTQAGVELATIVGWLQLFKDWWVGWPKPGNATTPVFFWKI